MKPFVSIAMTTYNGEKFLKQQLESILDQTYENFELIICDDASTDRTVEIIKSYQDKRIRLYKNDKNIGFAKNFEKAISLCSGKYIALADQDDIWVKEKIEEMVHAISQDENITLVYGDEYLIDEKGEIIADSFFEVTEYATNKHNVERFYSDNWIYGHNMLFSSKLKPFLKDIPVKFYDTWIAIVAAKMGRIVFLNKKLGYYRQHSRSVTGFKRKKRSFLEKVMYPIDWQTYKIWNLDRIRRLENFKRYFPEDSEYIDKLINYYSHQNRLEAFVFALNNINNIIPQRGLLRKIKYILLPLFAPKTES